MAVVVGAAAVMRVWGLTHDLPFSFYGDELHFIKRSMALGAGDLNPHWFHKPAFLMYVLAFAYGLYFVGGSLFGVFESPDAFGAHFLHDAHDFILIGRSVVALFGVATVYVVYLMARHIFRTRSAAMTAGLSAAVLLPMIVSSQQVKADVPCAFFLTLSLYWYIRSFETRTKRRILIAAAFAGVAMGTKYYGVVLLPVFAAGELLRRFKDGFTWNHVFARGSLVLALFVVGFFVTSPYNFLDPTWFRTMTGRIENVTSQTDATIYDPDHQIEYKHGVVTMVGATIHFTQRLLHPHALGLALAGVMAIGLFASLRRPRFRVAAGLLATTAFCFLLATITLAPYHANARHFNAIYPLLCVLLWPGAMEIARLARIPAAWRNRAALVVCALVLLNCLRGSVDHNISISRLDSRVAAYRWLLDNLPRDEGVLVDDYGPILQPNAAAVERQSERMQALGLGEDGFTRFHKIRLDLLKKYPAPSGFDLTELGHAWWLPREATNEELRGLAKHRDMGNPLIDRIPRPLGELWGSGVRYVVTNSEARGRYFPDRGPPATDTHPTWVRFYDELKDNSLVKTFDPRDWGGQGPIIWVYKLTRPGS